MAVNLKLTNMEPIKIIQDGQISHADVNLLVHDFLSLVTKPETLFSHIISNTPTFTKVSVDAAKHIDNNGHTSNEHASQDQTKATISAESEDQKYDFTNLTFEELLRVPVSEMRYKDADDKEPDFFSLPLSQLLRVEVHVPRYVAEDKDDKSLYADMYDFTTLSFEELLRVPVHLGVKSVAMIGHEPDIFSLSLEDLEHYPVKGSAATDLDPKILERLVGPANVAEVFASTDSTNATGQIFDQGVSSPPQAIPYGTSTTVTEYGSNFGITTTTNPSGTSEPSGPTPPPPTTPTTTTTNAPTNLAIDPATDNGISNSDGITNNPNINVVGDPNKGDIIKVYDGVIDAAHLLGQGIVGDPIPIVLHDVPTTVDFNIPIGPLSDGTHTIIVTATDPSGNVSQGSSLPITIDTAPATINSVSLDGTILGTSTIVTTHDPNYTLAVSTSDTLNGSGIGIVSFKVDGVDIGEGFFNPTTQKYEITSSFLGPGNDHTLEVDVEDVAGNMTTLNKDFGLIIDTTQPGTLSVTDPVSSLPGDGNVALETLTSGSNTLTYDLKLNYTILPTASQIQVFFTLGGSALAGTDYKLPASVNDEGVKVGGDELYSTYILPGTSDTLIPLKILDNNIADLSLQDINLKLITTDFPSDITIDSIKNAGTGYIDDLHGSVFVFPTIFSITAPTPMVFTVSLSLENSGTFFPNGPTPIADTFQELIKVTDVTSNPTDYTVSGATNVAPGEYLLDMTPSDAVTALSSFSIIPASNSETTEQTFNITLLKSYVNGFEVSQVGDVRIDDSHFGTVTGTMNFPEEIGPGEPVANNINITADNVLPTTFTITDTNGGQDTTALTVSLIVPTTMTHAFGYDSLVATSPSIYQLTANPDGIYSTFSVTLDNTLLSPKASFITPMGGEMNLNDTGQIIINFLDANYINETSTSSPITDNLSYKLHDADGDYAFANISLTSNPSTGPTYNDSIWVPFGSPTFFSSSQLTVFDNDGPHTLPNSVTVVQDVNALTPMFPTFDLSTSQINGHFETGTTDLLELNSFGNFDYTAPTALTQDDGTGHESEQFVLSINNADTSTFDHSFFTVNIVSGKVTYQAPDLSDPLHPTFHPLDVGGPFTHVLVGGTGGSFISTEGDTFNIDLNPTGFGQEAAHRIVISDMGNASKIGTLNFTDILPAGNLDFSGVTSDNNIQLTNNGLDLSVTLTNSKSTIVVFENLGTEFSHNAMLNPTITPMEDLNNTLAAHANISFSH